MNKSGKLKWAFYTNCSSFIWYNCLDQQNIT